MAGGLLLGVDTGGTFTDFVLAGPDGRLRVHKVLSTPEAPERAILQGVRELGLDPRGLVLVHGSTVATNAVLEGKGARTAFVASRGFADLLTIGRQARERLYDLQPPAPPPPVPPELCLETGGRLDPEGRVVEPLTAEDLAALRAALERLRPEAVAVCLLFAFRDGRLEREVARAVPPGCFTALSSEVLPEYREYERAVATWLTAYVGPKVAGYLERLAEGLPGAALSVMHSAGGTLAAAEAARLGAHLLLSGPAGGLAGARFVGALAGRARLLTFDMGGTSTDVGLIADGEIRLTSEGRIGRFPVALPMVDMHTIGAGGGSIARVDAGGMLHVGPQSAGADPGPACYGRGGDEPTVTDANLVLGRLRPEAFLGGAMRLDAEAARAAVARVAGRLGLGVEEAALGIVRLANEHMARALRVISVERGVDPRDHTLVSFGGAGGLHVCALAEALGMREALVPVHAGVLSALGMLAAPRTRRLSRTLALGLDGIDRAAVEAAFAALEAEGRAALAREGLDPEALACERLADLRYAGQSYTLTLPWRGPAEAAEAFHAAHRARYGHALDLPVELVNVRVAVRGPTPALALAGAPRGGAPAPAARVAVHGAGTAVPVWERARLPAGFAFEGPALVTETVATTWVAPGWRVRVDRWGNLLLARA